MKTALPVVALVLSGLAIVLSLWPKDAPPPLPPPAAIAPTHGMADAELVRRVEALEESTNDLWLRVARLSAGSGAALDGGAIASADPALALEVARLREEVRSVMVGDVMGSESGRSVFKDALREVQQELQQEQRAARQQQWAQQQQQQAQERSARWKQFATDAKLTWDQEQKLNARLDAEEKSRAALMAEVEAGTRTFRDLRQGTQAERRATDEAMKQTLSEEQLLQYQATRREDFGGGRGGGGFPGGGRGNRGGGGQAPRGGQTP